MVCHSSSKFYKPQIPRQRCMKLAVVGAVVVVLLAVVLLPHPQRVSSRWLLLVTGLAERV